MTLDDTMKIIDLGKIRYEDSLDFQISLVERRKEDLETDTLILAEHPPTITLGSDEKWNVVNASEEEIFRKGIDLHKNGNGKKWISRGGGAAYLGPGQLIGYVVMDVSQYGIFNFLRMLEEVMMKTAKGFGIEINRVDRLNPSTDKLYRATWYEKDGRYFVLCTKGIGIKSWKDKLITHHGFALNVNEGYDHYDLIDPCGFPKSEIEPISMQKILKREINMKEVKEKIVRNFGYVFKREMEYGVCV
ncbi:MAG: hypothetical protein AABW58_04845 [Nanoarchaeota archaeon]